MINSKSQVQLKAREVRLWLESEVAAARNGFRCSPDNRHAFQNIDFTLRSELKAEIACCISSE